MGLWLCRMGVLDSPLSGGVSRCCKLQGFGSGKSDLSVRGRRRVNGVEKAGVSAMANTSKQRTRVGINTIASPKDIPKCIGLLSPGPGRSGSALARQTSVLPVGAPPADSASDEAKKTFLWEL